LSPGTLTHWDLGTPNGIIGLNKNCRNPNDDIHQGTKSPNGNITAAEI